MEIIIIGGFLGSGKTSAINHLIADALEKNLNPAVIMNEFGKRSVDGQLIERPEVPMSEITEGCICCAMKSDVSQQLHELYLKYQPDIIFIECSGVAEPLAVVDACFTPVLAPFITLRSMVGIIDASMYSRIKSYPQDIAALFYEQLRHCATLFVNKIDKIEVEETARLLRQIERLNSDANIQVGQFGELNLKSLLEPTHINSNACGTLHSNINHQFIENPRLQTKEEMISALDNLPQDVYRVKGFVRFSDQQHV
jgi:Putative GTPases (G3E family)